MAKGSESPLPQITGVEQGSDPSTPSAGRRLLYPKADGWYDIDDAGAVVGPFAASVAAATFSGCSLTKSAAQTALAASTYHAVTFDGESFDTDAFHDNVTNPSRITIPTTNYYMVGGSGEWVSIVSGKALIARFYVDGAQIDGYDRRYSGATATQGGHYSKILSLTAGQYVEFRMFQGDTTARDIAAGAVFWCYKIG